ncbi:Wzz/FepE/Etk N-terminal domain-containing protein [Algoriphagus namhaensis]|uniref:Wzz/FepE/Etk N-terminal domain-containing protein n=1 Tax=Algoriphagus namhaensis TaxID=915353 RepID=A0ABV8AV90_9BACT
MDKEVKEILMNDDFTIINIFKLAKRKSLLLIVIIALFMLGGLIYYYTTPKMYATMSVLLVESQQKDKGGLSSLASVAGLGGAGFGAESATLDPALYPVILQSKPFLEELINSKVWSENYPDSVTIFKYMVENMPDNSIYKVFKRPMSVFDESTVINDAERLASRPEKRVQYESLELLILYKVADLITLSSEGRILTIMAKMPEPGLAYQFSQLVQSLLIDYATEYLQEKQRSQVEYLEAQHAKSEEGFKKSQATLASFRERNQGLYLESQKAIEQNLSSDYNLKFDLYRTVAQELERARIELNSQKPIFTSIEPPFIPNKPASPRMQLTLGFCFAIGFIFGLIAIVLYYIRAYIILRA